MQMDERSKKKYDAPEMEIVRFGSEDIITTSGGNNGDTSGHSTMMPMIY